MKQRIRLTESDLHRIIRNTVKKALREDWTKSYDEWSAHKNHKNLCTDPESTERGEELNKKWSQELKDEYPDADARRAAFNKHTKQIDKKMGRKDDVDESIVRRAVTESLRRFIKEDFEDMEDEWPEERIDTYIDTEANLDDFPPMRRLGESVNEIGDTAQGQYMLGRLQARQQYRHGQETGENDGYGYAYGSGGKQDATCDYARNKRQGEQYGTMGNPYHAAQHYNGYNNEFARQQKLHPNKWANNESRIRLKKN